MSIHVLDGSNFFVSDDAGDAYDPTEHGLFFRDTRFLSRLCLRLDGNRLQSLSAEKVVYYAARFFLLPQVTNGGSRLTVVRGRMLSDGLHEDIVLLNGGRTAVDIHLEFEVDADFRDLFEIKESRRERRCLVRLEEDSLLFGYRRQGFVRETMISFSGPASIRPGRPALAVMEARVGAKDSWHLGMSIVPCADRDLMARRPTPRPRAGRPRSEQGRLDTWLADKPTLQTDYEPLQVAYATSLEDLAALRFFPAPGEGPVPAAGLPWFMALFGRDSIITSLQTLPFLPEFARGTLTALAGRQAREYDEFRDAEPGKILHEERRGELAVLGDSPHCPYYGSSDATPLYLILLEAYERWTGDRELVLSLEPNARAALAWIDRDGDADGDGFVEYERRSRRGLDNQCWKDSWNSILFADGRIARPPLAVVEIQAYVVAAQRGCARLAEEVWGDPALAAQLHAQADRLAEAIDLAFWLPGRGTYALGLDRDKRPVDSLTSNIGHLLWAGACTRQRAKALRDRLLSKELFSGWGVRTMSATDAGYDPLEYHNGTIWPHDNSLIAAGLARYGFRAEATRVAEALLAAAVHFGGRLPEVFSGEARETMPVPVRYGSACAPQAWSAGAPISLLSTLLGLEASPGGELRCAPSLPGGSELIELVGVRHRRQRYRLRATREAGARVKAFSAA